MPFCASCKRSDIDARWAFCPRCGSALAASAPQSGASAGSFDQPKDLKNTLIDLALDAAESMVRRKVDQKFGAFTQLLNLGNTTSAPSVSSSEWPQWYSTAVSGGQPQLDATERARLLAKEISDARANTQMAEAMIQHIRDMSNITKGGY